MKKQVNEQYIAIYSRKSKFSEKGESIGNQIDLCKAYIETHFENASNRIVVFEDEGYSGGNLHRPGFKKMMEDVEKRKIEAIVVYRLDRISRDVGDFSNLINELNQFSTSICRLGILCKWLALFVIKIALFSKAETPMNKSASSIRFPDCFNCE